MKLPWESKAERFTPLKLVHRDTPYRCEILIQQEKSYSPKSEASIGQSVIAPRHRGRFPKRSTKNV